MANRLKEDEKNERVIRGLLKLPENRRCINCNSLGPQYVCTNFWTFVCTTCSGIHREFTHRVKSISMAKFTSQEVNALQVGGNQQAKEIYFKEWDSQRSVPDSSNVERLRDFIKHVYVDKRFTGERNYDKPPRVKMGEKEDFYDNQRPNSYQGGSRSPQYEDNERRYSNKSSPGGSYDGHRSPGYDQESRKYGNQGRSPSRPEFVSDWRRDDRFGNGKRDEDDGRSLERPKDLGSSSPPVVRPVRDILGENTVPLRISEPPKPVGRAVDVSSQTQGTASLSSLGSTNEKPVEVKLESAVSLIDFDAEPEHPAAPAAPQPQQSIITQSTTQPVYQNNDNNWASFDAIPQTKLTQSPNLNPLESVLSELSIMAPISGHASGIHGKSPPVTASTHTVASVSNTLTFPLGAAPVAASGLTISGGNSYFNISGAGQGLAMQPQQASLFPYTGNQSTMQQFTPVAGPSSNQPWNFSPAQSMQGFLNTSTAQASQPFADVKSRKELPEDIFTTTYSAFPAKVPGWQMGPPGGMGFPMQYNNTSMPMSTFQQLSKSTNPFDFSSESSPVQAPTLPSMASMAMPGVLPNTLPQSGLMRTSSLGTPSSAWMPQPSSYTLAFPQAPPYASAMPPVPRAHMGQQVVSNMPLSRHQGVGSFRAEGTSFNSVNVDQQLAGRFSAPTTPSPFSSVGGNPFG